MKFGIMAPYQLAPVDDGAYVAGFARLAEEMGFESIWVVDHVVMCPDYESKYPYDPSGRSPMATAAVQPDPLIWLTWAAAATREIRLATGILILPQRNPVVLAKELASLDALSGGRLQLGIGVGWVREEAVAVGVDFENRGRRTDEYIEAMRALWREELATFKGEYVQFDRVASNPKPAGPGGVPILIGGHSRVAARRAGRLGDGFYPLGVQGEEFASLLSLMAQTAREAGRDPDAIEITCTGGFSRENAESWAGLGADRMLVSPRTGDLAKLRPLLEKFREEVIEPLG